MYLDIKIGRPIRAELAAGFLRSSPVKIFSVGTGSGGARRIPISEPIGPGNGAAVCCGWSMARRKEVSQEAQAAKSAALTVGKTCR
jgi:hypothetical protein